MKKQYTINTDIVVKYLSGKGDNKSKKMIDKIIHDNEESRREFEEYVHLWEKSAGVGDFERIDPEKDWLKVRSRLHLKGTKKRIPLRSYFFRVAAILILAVGLAYLLAEILRTTSNTDTNYIEIAAGKETREIDLHDGSKIYLNKHSKIIRNSSYGDNNRDIILEGEAFFEVASNKELPFKVHTMNSTIEVVGTSFNVHTDSIQVTVSVLAGKVAFYASKNIENRIELERENSGVFEIKKDILTPINTIDYNQLAWHTGVFKFDKEPLFQVCKTLASYYNLDFIASPDVQFIDSVTVDIDTKQLSLKEIAKNINSSLDEEDVAIIPSDTKLFLSKQ